MLLETMKSLNWAKSFSEVKIAVIRDDWKVFVFVFECKMFLIKHKNALGCSVFKLPIMYILCNWNSGS